MKRLLTLIGIGSLAGVALGYFLKWIQIISGEKVYVLLLNIDYMPLLGSWLTTEIAEFTLHVCVSIILVIVLYYSIKKLNLRQNLLIYILMNIVIGVLLWGTTTLSNRTPEFGDVTAFFYWLTGHALFGSIVGLLIKLVKTEG
ncbi:hypothetical protein [Virgibacillus sp. DJP39]|uniref:hypothetical protein n=1 Tax=Virgibacillus sp. DJP39 TaxID=3409790 RepID=UPI003BB4CCFD